jgi:phenylpropionate dioxygenase-like ring-hydroxylating dioxygenase large terminal subunit
MAQMKPIAAGRSAELIELDRSSPAGPAAEMIFGEWYPALRADTLGNKATATTTLCGIPLLIGRKSGRTSGSKSGRKSGRTSGRTSGRKSSGELFALRDLCPHRGIPLSAGWFDGETVQCKYHGWRFEPCSGRCEEIPSLTSFDNLSPQRIFANAFPVRERDGYAWVYVPAAGAGRLTPESALPPVPELPLAHEEGAGRYRTVHLTAVLPCNVDHGIIGLMDPAHGPFVHRAWWWRSAGSIHEKTKRFEGLFAAQTQDGNDGFRMSAHAPSANSAPYKLLGKPVTTIDFTLPGRRTETIVAEKNGRRRWFSSLTTVTPLTASTCRIDVVGAWNFLGWMPFVTPVVRLFGNRFVAQDQQTMVEQARGLRAHPAMMLIDDADQPAKWYFALKQRRLTGAGEHPLAGGPVELHWRS